LKTLTRITIGYYASFFVYDENHYNYCNSSDCSLKSLKQYLVMAMVQKKYQCPLDNVAGKFSFGEHQIENGNYFAGQTAADP